MAKVVSIKRGRGRPVTTEGHPSFHMRVPPDLFDEIREEAHRNYRSVSGEVLFRLFEYKRMMNKKD